MTPSIIIEQTNPVSPNSSAIYNIKKGNESFNHFILSYPRGAYTGMRTIGKGSIIELNSHMKRIVTSLSLMKFSKVENDNENESENIRHQMESFRDLDLFEEKLVPMIKKGLEAFYEYDPTAEEAKISVMCTYSFDLQLPCFALHLSKLQLIQQKRVKVEVFNKMRTMPAVKDSQWVRDRESLEKNKRTDCNEVLLSDDHGNIYEGMASNFFAVRQRSEEELNRYNDTHRSKYVVVCASLEYVLLGTVMKIIMAICEREKIDIEWVFPNIQDARLNKWEGCFLTSTTRLLLPIETIYTNDGSSPIEFQSSDFIQQLQEKVYNEISNRSYKIM
ncbi:unnamed protein product [Cunninghamella blakesleeana]